MDSDHAFQAPHKTISVKSQITIGVLVMLVVILVLGVVKYLQVSAAIAQHANFAPPPDAVTSVTVSEVQWPREYRAVGSLKPFEGVTISAEEPGKVMRVLFESGQNVQKGAVLVELDTSVEEANLKAAIAKQVRTEKAYTRAQTLRTSNAVSADTLENAEADYREAQAQVLSIKAQIAKKTITAQFDGRTGIRMVNVGQYLAAGTPIVPLQSLDPMYVNFNLPQQVVPEVTVGQPVKVTIDAFPGQVFEGKLNAINPSVDSVMRYVELQATIHNPQEKLRAGMFANITLTLPENDTIFPIPSSSISFAPYGDSVFVIEPMKDPKGKEYIGVKSQIVKLGERRGELIAVTQGLKTGDQVVTSGIFKLRPGSAVVVNNTIKPGESLSPNPADT